MGKRAVTSFAGLDNIILGEVLAVLEKVPPESVNPTITPPYCDPCKEYVQRKHAIEDRTTLGCRRVVSEALATARAAVDNNARRG